jgi:PPM family protein phosphatase
VTLRWRCAAATHVGRVRSRNEDAFRVDEARGVFLVADGMGGHAAGDVASTLAAEVVGDALAAGVERGLRGEDLSAAMRESFRAAGAAIAAHAASDPGTDGMGTTLTACVLAPDGTLRIGHVGDSRAYLLRDGRLVQVTRDHTLVQREVDAGRLSPARARRHHLSHVLTRALGTDAADEPDLLAGRAEPGDLLLLATDGLTGLVPDRGIARILQAPRTLQERVERLVHAANRRGGRDNITAVLVECSGAE